MNEKRLKAIAYFLPIIKEIGGSDNEQLYIDLFEKMSNKDFDALMVKLRDGDLVLPVIAPNDGKNRLSVKKNFTLSKKLGFSFFQYLKFEGDKNIQDYITPNKFHVSRLPVRRAAQLLTKGISVPTDDRKIDLTTGQVTGDSKSSKLTMPEVQVLVGLGLEDSVVELMKYRGGDLGGLRAMDSIALSNGEVSQDTLEQYATGVTSTKTLKTYFTAMHIKNTL